MGQLKRSACLLGNSTSVSPVLLTSVALKKRKKGIHINKTEHLKHFRVITSKIITTIYAKLVSSSSFLFFFFSVNRSGTESRFEKIIFPELSF